MGRLDGEVALITGGSKGIGLAIAQRFAAEGAQVMINSRKVEACESAVEAIGHGAGYVAGNAGDPADIERMVATTIDRFGAVDVLVNNAATNPYAGPTIEIDRPRWDKTVQVNLTGPLFLTQEVWRAHQAEHGGVVVNISSVGGLSTNPVLGPYDVTKAALIHLTEQLAAELAPGVRVNAIAPGLVKTDFARMLWEGGRGDEVARQYPLQRLGETDDIAAAALFLADEATSGWMTGQTLVVDGGGLVAYSMLG